MNFKPTTFGRYALLKRIAVGGMAEVFRAMAFGAESFRKPVAIKRMLPMFSRDPQFVDMFINEAKLAANLNHANVVQIYDFGQIDKQLYLSMEYVPGKNIAEIIESLKARGLTAPIELTCYIFTQVLNGLQQAHQHRNRFGQPINLIHRDISPPNIIVSYAGEVKIADFGIAKASATKVHTASGVLKGKYAYMSPEQASGKNLDYRTDLFSMGICFYELLTLSEMFTGKNDLDILRNVRNADFILPRKLNLAIPKPLEDMLLKALRKDPKQRYASAAEWRDEIEKFLANQKLRFSSSWLATFMKDVFREEIQTYRKQQNKEANLAEKLRPDERELEDLETLVYRRQDIDQALLIDQGKDASDEYSAEATVQVSQDLYDLEAQLDKTRLAEQPGSDEITEEVDRYQQDPVEETQLQPRPVVLPPPPTPDPELDGDLLAPALFADEIDSDDDQDQQGTLKVASPGSGAAAMALAEPAGVGEPAEDEAPVKRTFPFGLLFVLLLAAVGAVLWYGYQRGMETQAAAPGPPDQTAPAQADAGTTAPDGSSHSALATVTPTSPPPVPTAIEESDAGQDAGQDAGDDDQAQEAAVAKIIPPRAKPKRKRPRLGPRRKKKKRRRTTSLFVNGRYVKTLYGLSKRLKPGTHTVEMRTRRGKVLRRWKIQVQESTQDD